MKAIDSGRIRSHLNNMCMLELADKLQEFSARIDNIIWLPGAIGDGDAIAESLKEMLEEDFDTLDRCFGVLPNWLKDALQYRDGVHAFAEWANEMGLAGFVIQMATPVMTHSSPTSSTFSWGHYKTEWIHGDTLLDAVAAGLAWVQQCRIKEGAHVAPEDLVFPDTVFLDFETTGLNTEGDDEVLEVALVDAAGTVLLNSLVRPVRKTEWPEAMAVHGITPDMVRHAPTLLELGDQIRSLLQGRNVVAYHMAYDLGFLWPELDGHLTLGEDIFPHCALRRFQAVRGVWDQAKGDYKRWKLQDAAEWVGHEWTGEKHRALADAQACRSVWLWLEGWK